MNNQKQIAYYIIKLLVDDFDCLYDTFSKEAFINSSLKQLKNQKERKKIDVDDFFTINRCMKNDCIL